MFILLYTIHQHINRCKEDAYTDKRYANQLFGPYSPSVSLQSEPSSFTEMGNGRAKCPGRVTVRDRTGALVITDL